MSGGKVDGLRLGREAGKRREEVVVGEMGKPLS